MPNQELAEFYGRVAHFEKARAQGYGFEAPGTLGRKYFDRFHKTGRKRRPVVMPLLIVAICTFGLKAAIHAKVGATAYNDRVAAMQSLDGVSRLGAALMQVDPITLYLSEKLVKVLR